MVRIHPCPPFFGGIAQLARACGSYPQCPEFKSLCRHHFFECISLSGWTFQFDRLFAMVWIYCWKTVSWKMLKKGVDKRCIILYHNTSRWEIRPPRTSVWKDSRVSGNLLGTLEKRNKNFLTSGTSCDTINESLEARASKDNKLFFEN